MNSAESRSTGYGFLVAMAAFVIVAAGMRAAQSLVVPFLLSAFIAILCAPALHWLMARKVPVPLAMLVLIVGLLVVLVGLAAVMGTSIRSFLEDVPVYQEKIQAMTNDLLAWVEARGIAVPDEVSQKSFNPQGLLRFAGNLLNSLSSLFGNVAIIFVTVAFMLLEASSFPAKIAAAFRGSDESMERYTRIARDTRRYMVIKTWVSLMTGAAVTVWLLCVGVDYAILWGLLAFLFNYIPNIGSIIAAIPAVILALVQLGGGGALWTIAGYVVVNGVAANVIEPRMMGKGLGLSTLVVFLSLVFWGWVLGPVGMLLSAPLTMAVKIVLESSDDTRWIAIFLGSEGAAKAATASPPDPPPEPT